MTKIKLNENFYKELDTLIKISNSIKHLYKKLSELENSNKKDSSEYHKYLDYLKMTIEVEKAKYLEYELNDTKCLEWLSWLKDNFLNNKDIYRIINQLSYFASLLNKKGNRLVKKHLEKPNALKTENIFNIKDIEIGISDDVLKTFVLMLDNCYKNKSNKKFKIDTIYTLSYLYPSIEELLLINDFNIEPSLFDVQSKYLSELIEMRPLFYNNIVNNLLSSKVFQQLTYLTSISNKEVKKRPHEILIHYCYLKSLLFLSSEKQNKVYLNFFKKSTNHRKYFQKFSSKKLTEQLIYEGFTDVKNQKQKLK